MMTDAVCVGKIVGAHGIKGAVKIFSYTEIPEDIIGFPDLKTEEGAPIKLRYSSQNNQTIIAFIEGVHTRNQAEMFKGFSLFVPRSELTETEEDAYYITDLEGMSVYTEIGQVGTVQQVDNYGAGDLISVALTENTRETVQIPFQKEYVLDVNLETKTLMIDKDLFENLKELNRS